jgi:predicted metal-dependent hydrolase
MFVRNHRARRYVLRLRPDGTVRVTIPRGGTDATARQFAEKNVDWLRRQMQRMAARPVGQSAWHVGSEIFFRGETVRIAADVDDGTHTITFADQTIRITHIDQDCRRTIERHLHHLASLELPPRVFHFAKQHCLSVQRVTVRNQKSRWGSCSRRGTISLNWRLIQAPGFVADYIILHELMHFRQMNHSQKFWREVEQVCPDFRDAERWLKAHGRLLR